MAQQNRARQVQFSQPFTQIFLMVLVLGLTGALAFVALPRVLPIFEANPYLNGFIVFVFVIGVLACFWQVLQLINSVRWIEDFASQGSAPRYMKAPRLLASLASLLRARGATMQVNTTSARSILDSVATRIDEAREITRYIVNILIFLGLLGTFYGLATTVPAVVETIRGLAPQDGEASIEVFNRLMTGLEAQLGGMGVAFASSLLGLAGSLVVGLLELFAGHGQNRFYRELEEWLSSITRVGFSSTDEAGGDSAGLDHVANHLTDQIQQLRKFHEQAEASRKVTDGHLVSLAKSVEQMASAMGEQKLDLSGLDRLADGQNRLIQIAETPAEPIPVEPMDAESRMRLRSIDVQMLKILEELSGGRADMMAEIRSDLSALTNAVGPKRRKSGN
jgi:hypothetical protein